MRVKRRLNEYEFSIISRLLESEFEGKAELILQVEGIKAEDLDDTDNYGSILLSTQKGKSALVKSRVPVEAEYDDSDGVPVAILLHVVDGFVHELEFTKADGTEIKNRAAISDLKVIVN